MFYNRTDELAYLDSKFDSAAAELIILWGRRRIGKTYLLREFCKRHNGLFLMATASSGMDNLMDFSQTLADYFQDTRLQIAPLQNWDDFFLYLHEKLTTRTVIVIDEYPYLVETNPGISTILQKHWDLRLLQNSHAMFILNGSAISMMEKETLNYHAPLYGRRTGQWFLENFDPISSAAFFKITGLIEIIKMYAVTSGVPFYCNILSREPDLFSAIENRILRKGEILFEEVDFLLRQEFKTPRSYFPILKTISLGSRKFGEISSKTGYDKSNLTKYLASLEQLKLIRREIPISENRPEKSRRGLYFLNDNLVDFWFQFVFPNKSELESGNNKRIMNEYVVPQFDYYVSRQVEPIIIDLLKRDFFQLGWKFSTIGRDWDKNNEIDIMGITESGQKVIGEIKWTEKPCDRSVYASLTEKNLRIKDGIYLIVSKSGFTSDLLGLASESLHLVDLRKWKVG
ncbi:ATP-binding protein [candidate division KSB1 bacterium]|nr:ATP-binding protein [candidate division KSB1 bacterium]